MSTFLERLQQAAKTAGVNPTQSEIAASLGIPRQRVHKWFQYGAEPNADQTFEIARAWGVDAEWLRTGDGAMHPDDKLSAEERELVKNYRSATPKVRDVIRTMTRAARKSVVVIGASLLPLIPPSPAEAGTLHSGILARVADSLHIARRWLRRIFSAVAVSTTNRAILVS